MAQTKPTVLMLLTLFMISTMAQSPASSPASSPTKAPPSSPASAPKSQPPSSATKPDALAPSPNHPQSLAPGPSKKTSSQVAPSPTTLETTPSPVSSIISFPPAEAPGPAGNGAVFSTAAIAGTAVVSLFATVLIM